MSIIQFPYSLSAASSPVAGPSTGSLNSPTEKAVFQVGTGFTSFLKRRHDNLSFADWDAYEASESARLAELTKSMNSSSDDADIGSEPESRLLLERDPKEWKSQDHYAVLGLSALRYKATPDQIKRAHRKKVLKHHPDKKASAGGTANDDSFFKCIAKAHDVLANITKRQQYDSADDGVIDPEPLSGKNPTVEEFLEHYTELFDIESRFSKNQPVPSIGTAESTKREVEDFYDFWYNFDSWRSYEYLDKDVNEGSDSRDEKRYAEKKNKSERARRKKEDIARLRDSVDKALAQDPRIKKFKADEKAARAAKKSGKPLPGSVDAKKKEEEEKLKAQEEARLAEEAKKQAENDKEDREKAKKAREAAKKNLKKEKKNLKTIITGLNYLQPAGSSASADVIDGQLTTIDTVADKMDPTLVGAWRKELEGKDANTVKEAIIAKAKELEIEAKGF